MKNFPFFIARRYLFSKKSHNAINIISAISVCGVALAAMALVCTLSVFNGFGDLVASFFTAFDPQIKVTVVDGKTVRTCDSALIALHALPEVQTYTECLEENALVTRNGRQVMVTIKGVDDHFAQQIDAEKLLYGDGEFMLHSEGLEFGVPGIGLASALGMGAYFEEPLKVYAPKKGERVNMANPLSSFNQGELYSSGVVFAVKQAKYDASYVITSLSFAQNLFDRKGELSSVELTLHDNADVHAVKEKLKATLGPRFRVQDRYEQQEDVFRIMKIEKLIAYLFLTFILLVACFNIIGSLSMLMIEKKNDVRTLRSLGATNQQIVQIFLLEGRMISTFGAVLGIVLGLLLCWAQQEFGLIAVGTSDGSFVVDAYPVSVHLDDVLLVFVTVLLAGYLAVWYPVRHLSRRMLM